MGVATDSFYASSYEDGTLYLTLLRSPAYCALPLYDREVISQDRYIPHIDQGERCFAFVLTGGERSAVETKLPRVAAVFNESPYVLSSYPSSGGVAPCTPFSVSGDNVDISAFKKADDGNGYIVRMFNPFGRESRITFVSEPFGVTKNITLSKYEIKTFRLTKGKLNECNLLEEDK